jgi:3'-5' exoribonuclease
MPRRYVTQLGERENVDEVFLVSEKQLRTNRNGNLYLQVRLADRTGSLNAMLWNAADGVYGSFDNGDYLRVRGTAQVHNGALQIIMQKFDVVDPRTIDDADFTTLGLGDVDRLASRLQQLLRGMQSEPLRNLAECFLMDEQFMTRFTAAPAGVKNHHAYRGGLLDHVVSLMELWAAPVRSSPGAVASSARRCASARSRTSM